MPLLDFERVKQGIAVSLPGLPNGFRIVDGTKVMQHIRLVKSELEIDKMRTVCQMVGRAFETLPEGMLRR